jgi:hypothetical protein
MVAGEWVVLDRKLIRADVPRLAHDARRETQRLWRRLEALEPHTFEPKGGRRWQTTAV